MAITLRVEKSSQSFGYLSVLGFLFGICALVVIVGTAIDTYQESKRAKWPRVVATIKQQIVRKYAGRHDAWRIESELRYTVDGEELTSNIHSRATGSTEQSGRMRLWISQHQPGTTLLVRYDPRHHDAVVPDVGDMPESGSKLPDDLLTLLIFLSLSIALVTIGRVLQRRQLKPG